MENYNYFYIEDLTNDELKNKFPYISFLSEVDTSYYRDAFFFHNIDTMLIRTKDDLLTVRSHLDELKFISCQKQNIPFINYEMHDARGGVFDHPALKDEKISAEELYEWFAKKYRFETGIDFLKGELPPLNEPSVKEINTVKPLSAKRTIKIAPKEITQPIQHKIEF
jgi:hypothetical protein